MYYDKNELKSIGFKNLGHNVKISKNTSIYNPENIAIGSNVRIDDFSILSASEGSIVIHDHIHIAPFCNLIGKGGIEIMSFCGLSSRVTIYSATDDYSGNYLIGPVMHKDCLRVICGKVTLYKYVTIGTNSTIMPNVNINEGSVLGAHSLATKNINEWEIHFGCPAKFLKKRKKGLLNLVHLMEDLNSSVNNN